MGNFDIEIISSMCDDLRNFYDKYDIFESAWTDCERGDWMLNIAAKLNIDKRTLTLAKGHCVNTVRHLMMHDRSIKAVDTAIAFGEGRATDYELIASANGAYAYAPFDCVAAYSADYGAVSANWTAAFAAAAAADDSFYFAAAEAAAEAAAKAAAYNSKDPKSARKENQKLTADICRKYLTESVLKKIKEYEREV
jgi:hypothetical protein